MIWVLSGQMSVGAGSKPGAQEEDQSTELTILPTQMLNGAVGKIAYLKERNTQRKEDK